MVGTEVDAPSGQPAGHDSIAAEAHTPFRETRFGWLVLGVVWTACVGYLAVHLRNEWVPGDAGTLAQMADRVFRGQIPDRNFYEAYTGGLSYLNALAFRLFGVNFFSLRIPLFLFFLGWVPAVYFIARRFAGPIAATGVTLLAVAWSVPNYPEAMPSWYNLFFATWGTLALLRFIESEKKRWLWIAGFCAGLSFLVKISGLYFVAAALLFFIFREQSNDRPAMTKSWRSALPYRLFVTAGLSLFLISLSRLILQMPALRNIVHFVLPSVCLVTLLLWQLWSLPSSESSLRLRRLLAMGLPFIMGTAAPIAIFLLWYAGNGALRDWFRYTFFVSSPRLLFLGALPSPLFISFGLLPAFAIAFLACNSRVSHRLVVRTIGIAIALVSLVAAWASVGIWALVGFSAPLFVPAMAAALLILLLLPSAVQAKRTRQEVFLVVAAGVLWGLIQFPRAAPIYFCYAAPLVVLGIFALFRAWPAYDRVVLSSLVAFYLIFALCLGTPAYWFDGVHTLPRHPAPLVPLQVKRAGGIRIDPFEANEYERLISVVQRHATGPYMYCTPDCPELFFLSGRSDPIGLRLQSENLMNTPPLVRKQQILEALALHNVQTIVLGPQKNSMAPPLATALKIALEAKFPYSERIDEFEVRWK